MRPCRAVPAVALAVVALGGCGGGGDDATGHENPAGDTATAPASADAPPDTAPKGPPPTTSTPDAPPANPGAQPGSVPQPVGGAPAAPATGGTKAPAKR